MKTQKRSLFVVMMILAALVIMTGCANESDETVANTDAKIAEYLKEIPISELTQPDKEVLAQLAGMGLQFSSYEHPVWVVGSWEMVSPIDANQHMIHQFFFYNNGSFFFRLNMKDVSGYEANPYVFQKCGEWFLDPNNSQINIFKENYPPNIPFNLPDYINIVENNGKATLKDFSKIK